jgi:hypothetical protein
MYSNWQTKQKMQTLADSLDAMFNAEEYMYSTCNHTHKREGRIIIGLALVTCKFLHIAAGIQLEPIAVLI